MGFAGGAGAAIASAPAFVWGHRLAHHREVPAVVAITTVFLVMAFVTRRPPEMILGLGAVGLLVGLWVFLWHPRCYRGRRVS